MELDRPFVFRAHLPHQCRSRYRPMIGPIDSFLMRDFQASICRSSPKYTLVCTKLGRRAYTTVVPYPCVFLLNAYYTTRVQYTSRDTTCYSAWPENICRQYHQYIHNPVAATASYHTWTTAINMQAEVFLLPA
ncbi:hypothetical protein BR93DRAFT_502717 [Coniochaeta sp. PMI_546]|nr:hypothetical protein BR93DRAFT_502717 [Coniochaeta sp. PMI_546]